MKPRLIIGTSMLLAAFVIAGDASAAIWRWGCMGPLGASQIVSNRYQLLVRSPIGCAKPTTCKATTGRRATSHSKCVDYTLTTRGGRTCS